MCFRPKNIPFLDVVLENLGSFVYRCFCAFNIIFPPINFLSICASELFLFLVHLDSYVDQFSIFSFHPTPLFFIHLIYLSLLLPSSFLSFILLLFHNFSIFIFSSLPLSLTQSWNNFFFVNLDEDMLSLVHSDLCLCNCLVDSSMREISSLLLGHILIL